MKRTRYYSRLLSLFCLMSLVVSLSFCWNPESVRAEELEYVELGIEDKFVCDTSLANLYGKWDIDSFFYKRPAECEQYKFWYIFKSYSSNTFFCVCANIPLSIYSGSQKYLKLMLNCDGYSFTRDSCYFSSSDGINWTNHGTYNDALTISAYDKKTYKYYWNYKFCESNYYVFSSTNGNDWNNNKYVYFQPPYVRSDSEWGLAEVLTALGIPMPSYYKKGYEYLLYKTGDTYVLECIQDDDFTCYMEYIANANETLGQGLGTRIAPFFSSPDGVIDHRAALYYKDGAWSTYSDDNLMSYDSADPVSQDTIGVDYNVTENTYDSNWVLYSDFNLYRGGYNSTGEVLADYGVPYIMYDVESGSFVEGSTPPSEGGGTGGGSQIPDSSEDDSGDDFTTETEKDPVSSELEEVKKTSKGILGAIKDFFGGFFKNLVDAIAGLFLPEDGFFEDFFGRLNKFFDEKLGFLYVPIEILIDFLTKIMNAEPGEASIPLPEFKWEDTVILSGQDVELNFDAIPGLQDKIYFVTDVLMIGSILNLLQHKLKEILSK